MDESNKYAVGIDVGTENVRAVVATISPEGELAVVGYNEYKNAGMRKGIVADLSGPGSSIDVMLREAERMSGYEVNAATVSINGSHITTTNIDGMVAVGMADHEINENDLMRVQEVAMAGCDATNRTELCIVPHDYKIDGQDGIKKPVGMNGAKLQMRGCVVSTLRQNVENLKNAVESANIEVRDIVPTAVAAARAVLDERQKENGVLVLDIGSATTSMAVYSEGDLKYVGVILEGSNNITLDLAMILKTSPEITEEIKRRFVTGCFNEDKSPIIKIGGNKDGKGEHVFEREVVDAVVRDRLAEIFEEVRKRLRATKFDRNLPEGAVLVGGGAKMRDIEKFACEALEMAVKIGVPRNLEGLSDKVAAPEYAVAAGLMMLDADNKNNQNEKKRTKKGAKNKNGGGLGFIKRFIKSF